jgi:hypothetical protein
MRISEIEQLLPTLINANIPVYLRGAPGVGKTEMAMASATDIGAELIYFHAPTMNPEDLGVPDMSAAELTFKVNSSMPVYGSRWDRAVNPDAPDRIVVLIDELPQADHGVQKTLANVIQAYELYGHKILPHVSFVATGNRAEDRAGAGKLLGHFANRWCFLDVDFFIDDFLDWSLKHQVHPVLRAFAKFDSKQINEYKPDREINPTPRAWVQRVAPLLDAGLQVHLLYEAVKGSVGEGPATVFQSFVKMASHLNIDALMADPKSYPMPTESSILYVLSTTLAMKSTTKNFSTIMDISKRLPPEFSVLLVLEASKVEPRIMSTTAYQEWATGPGAKVLGIS